MAFVIPALIAFVVIDGDGDEAVPAMRHGDYWLPLLAADPEREGQMREHAKRLATQLGQPVLVLRFAGREQIGVIEP
jgi:hypothetical protein